MEQRLFVLGAKLSFSEGGSRDGGGAVAIKFMGTVLAGIPLACGPFGIDIHVVVKGGATGEIRRHHGFEGNAQAVLQGIDFQRDIGLFLKGPAELVGGHDHVGQTFVFLHGTVEGDVSHGQLTDLRLTSGFVIDIET